MKFLDDIENKINSLRVVDFNIETLASGNFIELKKGVYKLQNNESIVRETVVKKAGTGNAVAMFAVDCDNKILLVIQPRVSLNTSDKVNIELPAGYIEIGEDFIEAGSRELLEETGYVSDDIIIADHYYPSLGASGERITLLLMLNCKKIKDVSLDNDEYLFNVSVTLDEFRCLLDNDYLKDVNARIGYYRYLEYLGSDLNEKKAS